MKRRWFLFLLLIGVIAVFCFLAYSNLGTAAVRWQQEKISALATTTPAFVATHLKTPDPVKALYLTSWVAGKKTLRDKLVDLVEQSELNAVVIDIKDYTGRVAFPVDDKYLAAIGSSENRITDIKEFIASLHAKGIYVIGRIAVFQDSYMVAKEPTLAVKKMNDKTAIWKDFKGISWIDAGARDYWNYIAALGKEAHRFGFDELNFDYIRFPSDGDMKDIFYPWSDGASKTETLKNFSSYLRETLGNTGAVLSADLFGMTTTNTDDLNIGQLLENTLPYFDYVSPMVYPSHYPAGFLGLPNPAAKPYEVVRYSMDHALWRASTTPWKLRPWLQDFNLGATYTADMVRAEKQAVYDAGLRSWMIWNASNVYTEGALDKPKTEE